MNDKNHTLIVGAKGFLGHRLIGSNPNTRYSGISGLSSHEIRVSTGPNQTVPTLPFNFSNIRKVIELLEPKVIVNVAGLIGDKLCELDQEKAIRANIDFPKSIASIAKELNAQFIHFSTDAVFNDQQEERHEDTTPKPDSIYGRTKFEGELEVLAELPSSLIVRTNFVGLDRIENRGLFNFFARNFVERRIVTGYTDVMFNPISIRNLEVNLDILIRTNHRGIIHLAGGTKISKYLFGRLVGVGLSLHPNVLNELLSEGRSSKEVRKNMTLETKKMSDLNLVYGEMQKEVYEMCEELKK